MHSELDFRPVQIITGHVTYNSPYEYWPDENDLEGGCGKWSNNFILLGFVVAASNDVDIYYYMDEAGNVLSDMPEWAPVPEWGVDIKCGKGTNFRYVY